MAKLVKRAFATTAIFAALSSASFAQVQHVDQPKSAVIGERNQEIMILRRDSSMPLRLDKMLSDTLTESGATLEDVPQREVPITLDIIERESKIWSPNTGRFDDVRLRAYQKHGDPTPSATPYVAPVIFAVPGQTIRLGLNNWLDPDTECQPHTPDNMNDPFGNKCQNVTNNHFHGGHVSPDGISDNVLRELAPSRTHTYEYEYNIPADHPAGTFWYHPHVHGSTAIQVASGMAGALIVRGNRVPIGDETTGAITQRGDIDVLLKDGNKAIPDKVFVLQQIQYACRKGADGSEKTGDAIWSCDQGVTGQLDGYDLFVNLTPPNVGPRWAASGRFTTVNGVVGAPLRQVVEAGKPERWRFIHAGFADSIKLQLFKRKKQASATPGTANIFEVTPAAQQDEVIRRECDIEGGATPLFEIAADGLTRNAVFETEQRILHPGYRSDVLVAFPEPGEYCVLDMDLPPNRGVDGTLDTRRLLFTLTVEGAAVQKTSRELIQEMLVEAAKNLVSVSDGIRKQIQDDLSAGMALTLFAPHKTLANEKKSNDITGVFTLFSGKTRKPGANPTDPDTFGAPLGAGFSAVKGSQAPGDILRFSNHPEQVLELTVGDVDEWTVSVRDGEAVGHPFHIHVNPFEIISVTDKDGKDLTQDPQSQFFQMNGVWKDTIFVEAGTIVKFRTKYVRYTGDFVMHCHILYHEDQGMMQRVRIVDPGAGQQHAQLGHSQH